MVQTRSKARAVGASSLWTGVSSNSAGPSRNQRAPTAVAPATAIAAPANNSTAAAATPKAPGRKTTKKGGKSRGVGKAPRGRGRGRGRARPAVVVAEIAAAAPTVSAAPTVADATTQTEECYRCEFYKRRIKRRDKTIEGLNEQIQWLENDRMRLHRCFTEETRCHKEANEEIERLGGSQVDRNTPENERQDKEWDLVTDE